MTESGGGPAEVINDRYELLEIIGSGGMGVVYRARDRVLNRIVAVKVIRHELVDAEFLRRFEREAAILARVRSPHIVVVFDYGSSQGRFFLVTDYLADGDLSAWLAAHGPMPPSIALPLTAALAEGLADAHANGIIHRDIKPGNVLLWRRGEELRPVLADFGIAVTADLGLTLSGGVIGSPPFMAPERHLGQSATETTDIYALGCLLYNLLTGSPPYGGTNFQAANAHINDPIPTVPAYLPRAAELDAVIAKCMAKQPADRYATATEVATAVGALIPQPAREPEAEIEAETGSEPERQISTAPTTVVRAPVVPVPTHPDEHTPRRRMVPALLAVVLLVVGLAGGGWLLARGEGDDPSGAADNSSLDTPAVTSSSPTESVSEEPVPMVVDVATVPGATCDNYFARPPGREPVPLACTWFDAILDGFTAGEFVRVRWVYGTVKDGFSTDEASKRVKVDSDGTAVVGEHEAFTDRDGMCPAKQCAGGLAIPDVAELLRLWVTDSKGERAWTKDYDLMKIRKAAN